MKKIIIIAILFLAGLAVKAQDTVNETMSWYMFMPHEDIITAGYTHGFFIGNQMTQCYGKDSNKVDVYGVAVTLTYMPVEEDRSDETLSMTPTAMLLDHVAHGNPPSVSFIDSARMLGKAAYSMRQASEIALKLKFKESFRMEIKKYENMENKEK